MADMEYMLSDGLESEGGSPKSGISSISHMITVPSPKEEIRYTSIKFCKYWSILKGTELCINF
jgi:hypothetical protein